MLLRYKSIALTCLGSLGFLLFLGLHLPRRLHHKSAPKRLLQPVVNDIPLSSPPISQQGHLEQNFSSGRPAKEIVPPDAQFVFDASRDASNYGLNRGQCHAAFSELFSEINRAKSQWEGKVILPDDIDVSWKKDGLVRVLIHKRRLYVVEAQYSDSGYDIHRSLAILGSIHRAIIASHDPIPDVEFSICVNDVADPQGLSNGRPVWVLSRRPEDGHQWVMSDFGYWSWGLDLVGEYEQIRTGIGKTEPRFLDKKQKALWRGADTGGVRKALLEATKDYKSRWADVESISWSSRTKLAGGDEVKAISIPDHCHYAYLLHTEGVSYSGRGKYLQNCNSVVIMHTRRWIENYDHLLVPAGPQQNYVQVERDFSDLPPKMDYLLGHPGEAERIANNSVTAFRDRYLTPAAQACYWREMFHAWSEVSFVPELWEDVEVLNEAGQVTESKERMRGTPYETHVLTAFDELYTGCSWFKKIMGGC